MAHGYSSGWIYSIGVIPIFGKKQIHLPKTNIQKSMSGECFWTRFYFNAHYQYLYLFFLTLLSLFDVQLHDSPQKSDHTASETNNSKILLDRTGKETATRCAKYFCNSPARFRCSHMLILDIASFWQCIEIIQIQRKRS